MDEFCVSHGRKVCRQCVIDQHSSCVSDSWEDFVQVTKSSLEGFVKRGEHLGEILSNVTDQQRIIAQNMENADKHFDN